MWRRDIRIVRSNIEDLAIIRSLSRESNEVGAEDIPDGIESHKKKRGLDNEN